jgi:hypothetical protein
MMKRILSLGLLSLLLTGCTTTTVTNLTAGRQVRNSTGLYPFEAIFDSNQQSLVKESIQAYVRIGAESYPMRRTSQMKSRWESMVPIPGDKEFVNYQYKFDYEYRTVPIHKLNSKMSPPYQLQITPK